MIAKYHSGNTRGYRVQYESGRAEVTIRDGAPSITVNGTTQINDSKWHHIVGVFDRSDLMTVYIDGVNEDSVDISWIGNVTNSQPVTIGRRGVGVAKTSSQISKEG